MKEVEIWRYTSLLSPIPYPLSPIPSSTSKGVMEEQKIKGRDLYDTYFVTSEENNLQPTLSSEQTAKPS